MVLPMKLATATRSGLSRVCGPAAAGPVGVGDGVGDRVSSITQALSRSVTGVVNGTHRALSEIAALPTVISRVVAGKRHLVTLRRG